MIPVTTIGGYLGAGKTTLVNHLLRHAGGRRLAVLVNEFGALPIDADLIEAQDGDMISIAGGCICCSFGNDLIGALRDLAALDPAPKHILIEASGVAIPSGIAASVALMAEYELGAVVVLADVETVQDQAQDTYLGDTILRQLQDADLVLATKVDLVDAVARTRALAWLDSKARHSEVVPVANGEVPIEVVLGPRERASDPRADPHADALFQSHVIEVPHPVDVDSLAERLRAGGLGLVRAKGFLRGLDGKCHLVQLVGKRVETRVFEGPVSRLALVCIGRVGAINETDLNAVFAFEPARG
ncbi:MAG: GTP-binding protein [Arenibacterium sp.]